MSTPLRLDRWQTTYATIGSRYSLAYLAQGTAPITSGTIAEFKRVLDNRDGVSVEEVKLLGRVMSATVQVSKSASLLWLLGEYIIAGSPAVTFKLENVYALSPTANTTGVVQTVAQAPATLFNAGKDLGVQIGQAVSNAFDSVLPNVGESIGKGVSEVIKPLILPAILVLVGMYLYNQRGSR